MLETPNVQRLDRTGLIGRALSGAYVPRTGPDCDALKEKLARLHAQYADGAGLERLCYVTRVFLAQRLPTLQPGRTDGYADRGTGTK